MSCCRGRQGSAIDTPLASPRRAVVVREQLPLLSVLLEGVSDRWAKPRQIAGTKLMVNRDPDEPRS
jgi:hypothetical protein